MTWTSYLLILLATFTLVNLWAYVSALVMYYKDYKNYIIDDSRRYSTFKEAYLVTLKATNTDQIINTQGMYLSIAILWPLALVILILSGPFWLLAKLAQWTTNRIVKSLEAVVDNNYPEHKI